MSERVDMSAFEAQFETLVPGIPNDDFERLVYLKDRLKDLNELVAFRKERNLLIEIKQRAVNKLLDRVRALEKRLLQKRRPLDEELHINETRNREAKRTISSLERELARLLSEIEARERFIAKRNSLEAATQDFPWRIGVDGKKALPHQIEGAHRLVSAERAILGDKPGLGKTLQAIMTIDLLRAQGKGQKVLIFTPKSVVKDFERAFKLWTNPKFVHVLNQTLKGLKSDILDVITHLEDAVVITNYEVWRKDASIKQKLADCCFDTIILDEAHVLKNARSVTTQGMREIVYADNRCPKCGSMNIVQVGRDKKCGACEFKQEKTGDFCSIKNVFHMSGTPFLNRPQELFPLLNMMDREQFPTESAFLNDYCEKKYDYDNNRYYWTFGYGGSDRLLKKLGLRYTSRNRDSAGVEMPPQEIVHHWLELDPEKYPRQAKFIERLRENARLAFSEEHQMTTSATLAWYTRMRQAASWPDGIKVKGCAHNPPCLDDMGELGGCYAPEVIFPPKDAPPVGESVIMDESERIVFEAVESGDRIVVFSMFRSVLDELELRCKEKGISAAKLVGGIPESRRQEYIDDFNANETKVGEHKYDVLLCQYQTAKVGLNLHGAQQLLCVEREWNPGMEQQTLDRLRRLDSQFNSIVHILHCEGTATELIDAIQDQKLAVIEGFESDVNLNEAMRKFLEG